MSISHSLKKSGRKLMRCFGRRMKNSWCCTGMALHALSLGAGKMRVSHAPYSRRGRGREGETKGEWGQGARSVVIDNQWVHLEEQWNDS